jgi:hypothetical protein
VQDWTEGLVQIPERGVPMEDWWNSAMLSTTKQIKTQRASISIYTAWNLGRNAIVEYLKEFQRLLREFFSSSKRKWPLEQLHAASLSPLLLLNDIVSIEFRVQLFYM